MSPLEQIKDLMELSAPLNYHRWYYNRNVWRGVTFMGVYAAKCVLDLWNYQEILWELKPSLVVEFGTYAGGSALYLAWVMEMIWHSVRTSFRPRVITVDVDWSPLHELVLHNPYIMAIHGSSTDPVTIGEIEARRDGPSFFILDSDHHADHVLSELEMLRDLTRPGDYVVVEDTNINGHPVLPDFGPGPWEALEEYEKRHPEDYKHDTEREGKFGVTFAPRGYLIRQ
jgi:cephalosporin hydroxylase